MTAVEKTNTARFLDLARDFLNTGYRSERNGYNFQDDDENLTASMSNTQGSTASDGLENIAESIRACNNCPLGSTRTNAVPGEGVLNPVVMVIGEGPGADEDATGRPFVGRAGQLLDKMLASINLSRKSNCFIANVVKCRPPYNREPSPDESAACVYFLKEQILFLKPKFILCAGKISGQALLKTNDSVSKMRGKFYEFNPGQIEGVDTQPIPLLVTYHPSALLHSETYKRPAWEDLKLLRAKIESENGSA